MQAEDKEIHMPSNIQAESMLLGALLNDNSNLEIVDDYIKADHFYLPIHQTIYETILHFISSGQVASPVTMHKYLAGEESFEKSEKKAVEYLASLSVEGSSFINLHAHAKSIRDSYIRRSLMGIGQAMKDSAQDYDIDISTDQQIEEAELQLYNIATHGISGKTLQPIKETVLGTLERCSSKADNKGDNIKFGFSDLDRLLHGMGGSDLFIIAARPSMGKTAFAVNMAVNVAKDFLAQQKRSGSTEDSMKSVAVFSLEMSEISISNRMIAMESKVNSNRIKSGKLREGDAAEISRAMHEVSSLPIFVDDTSLVSISSLRTRARWLKRRHNLGLIVIDYLQLLNGGTKKFDSRAHEISEITRGLKGIAKDLDIPVIALSQLSRLVESRQEKKPLLSDLRESGTIEQDADVVMFIYREEYYLSPMMPNDNGKRLFEWEEAMKNAKNKASIIVAKNREGPVGTVDLYFDSDTTTFKNLSEVY